MSPHKWTRNRSATAPNVNAVLQKTNFNQEWWQQLETSALQALKNQPLTTTFILILELSPK
jgi:hypothetical protein